MAKHHPDLIFCRKQPGVGELTRNNRLKWHSLIHKNVSTKCKQIVRKLNCPFNVPAIGRLCEKCDGKCVICDSYVRPCTLVRICDECNYGSYQGRCVICGGPGVSDAYYCKECTIQEKDVREREFHSSVGADLIQSPCLLSFQRDGCPKIVNLGSSKTDLFYERKKYGFKQKQ